VRGGSHWKSSCPRNTSNNSTITQIHEQAQSHGPCFTRKKPQVEPCIAHQPLRLARAAGRQARFTKNWEPLHVPSTSLPPRASLFQSMTGDHCFGCTGGAGSSCGGAIVQVDRPRMLSGAMLDNCGSAAKLSASSKGLLDPPYASAERGGYKFTRAGARSVLLLRAERDCFGQ